LRRGRASSLGLAELALARHKPDEAALRLERALVLHDPSVEPEVELTLSEALWQAGKDRARARTLAGLARAWYERIGHRPGLDRATRWLDEHA
jgi:hypothetical protein